MERGLDADKRPCFLKIINWKTCFFDVEFLRVQVASQLCILWESRGSKAIYRVVAVAAELCEAAQLMCVFILGSQYLGPGVLRHVFGLRYAVSVLVIDPITVQGRATGIVHEGAFHHKTEWALAPEGPGTGPQCESRHQIASISHSRQLSLDNFTLTFHHSTTKSERERDTHTPSLVSLGGK